MTTSATMSKNDPHRVTVAWDWLVRMREDNVSEEELAAWLNWYQSDAANKDAYDEAQRLWQNAPRLIQAPGPVLERDWRRQGRPRASGFPRRWRMWSIGIAAAVFAVAVGLAVQLEYGHRGRIVSGIASWEHGSLIGDSLPLVQETLLPDGSKVQLAAHSSVSMDFTERERRLTMGNGVAFFTVAHNRERPFIVAVGKVNVRAVGTAFNIRNADGRVVVTVSEGSVDVYDGQPGDAGHLSHIAAGTELIWAREQAIPSVSTVDPARALAWREGRLDYVDEPLGAAIDDINRYRQRQILIRDPAVAQIRFSGSLRTDATEEWIRALPELFPVDVLTDSAGNIVLIGHLS